MLNHELPRWTQESTESGLPPGSCGSPCSQLPDLPWLWLILRQALATAVSPTVSPLISSFHLTFLPNPHTLHSFLPDIFILKQTALFWQLSIFAFFFLHKVVSKWKRGLLKGNQQNHQYSPFSSLQREGKGLKMAVQEKWVQLKETLQWKEMGNSVSGF